MAGGNRLKLEGKRASGGLAVGLAHLLDKPEADDEADTERGDDAKDLLELAIEAAVEALSTLAREAGEMGSEILDFQIALLEDDALVEPALEAISEGASAPAAWRGALNAQIADYAGSDDDYFQARAEDLIDLRDRVLANLAGMDFATGDVKEDAVLVGWEMTPSRFLAIDWDRAGGLALAGGSPSSHVAMLARARGLPMVVGLGQGIGIVEEGESVLLDADKGEVTARLDQAALDEARTEAARRAHLAEEAERLLPTPAATRSGQRVMTMVNVDDPDRLHDIPVDHCDGIGLTRTEFLFHDRADLPDEDEQTSVYTRILEWADGRPVTIRTLD
ncbi:MAG: phosphoenolpyruvate-utilizing N-terminal domain-containing protein, partial [Pseudomonadota bacterium]